MAPGSASPASARRPSPCRSRRRCATPTAATGAASSAPSSRSRPTRASPAWARWAAAARAPSRVPRAEAYLVGHDPFAARGAALQDRQPDRLPLQQPHADAGGARVRLPRHHRPEAGRAGLRHARRQAARPRCRSPPTCSSATRRTQTGDGEVRTADQLVAHAQELKAEYGFTSHKLKGGVFPPGLRARVLPRAGRGVARRQRSATTPTPRCRSRRRSASAGRSRTCNNDYYEDPVWGLNGMRRVREVVRIPTATNTVVVNFEQLAANILDPAVDVILLDTTFWGGIRPCIKAAGVCETFQTRRRRALLGRARHPARDHAAPGRRAARTSPSPPTRTTTSSPTTSSSAARCSTRTARSPCPTGPAWASTRPRQGRAVRGALRGSAATPTTGTRCVRDGSRWSRTPAGPTRTTPACRPWNRHDRAREWRGKDDSPRSSCLVSAGLGMWHPVPARSRGRAPRRQRRRSPSPSTARRLRPTRPASRSISSATRSRRAPAAPASPRRHPDRARGVRRAHLPRPDRRRAGLPHRRGRQARAGPDPDRRRRRHGVCGRVAGRRPEDHHWGANEGTVPLVIYTSSLLREGAPLATPDPP